MDYINRDLEEQLMKYISRREIIAIVGARQSGKTTIMERLLKGLKKATMISFEDRKILSLFETDIDSFIDIYVKNQDYLFIDEFQYAKEGGKKLKYLYDLYKIKLIISGSSYSELSIQSIKYLVGRIFVFTLFPLSFAEFLKYKDDKLYSIYSKNHLLSQEVILLIKRWYEEFIVYGGYPRVVLSPDTEEKKLILRNIYNTYLLKEIKEILGIKEDYKISKLMHALALQVGSLINYDEISQVTKVSYKELLGNLNVLKKTYIISESKPFFTNKRKELIKNPRFYFVDNGFRNFILNNFQAIENRTDKGQLHENFVSTELIKKEIPLQYWRTKSKAEVDFVVEKNGKTMPLEVKSDLKNPKVTRSLHSFIEKYKVKEAFVLTESLGDEIKTDLGHVRFIPIFNIGKI